jgi:hypothetical protein
MDVMGRIHLYYSRHRFICEVFGAQAMTTDRVDKLLEQLAMECAGAVIEAYGTGDGTNYACWKVLDKLEPLLRAGQEMAEHIGHGTYTGSAESWRAALVTLEGRYGK